MKRQKKKRAVRVLRIEMSDVRVPVGVGNGELKKYIRYTIGALAYDPIFEDEPLFSGVHVTQRNIKIFDSATSHEYERRQRQNELWRELNKLLASTAHTLSETVKELRTSDDEASGGINRWHAANRLEKIAKELTGGKKEEVKDEKRNDDEAQSK